VADKEVAGPAPEQSQNGHTIVGGVQVRSWALTGLALLATFYTLYLASEFLLPVVLALLLALLLSPLVLALRSLRIPDAVGAAIVVLSLVGAVAGTAYALSGAAADWLQQAPQIMREIERKVSPLREKVREVNQAAEQVERIAEEEDDTIVVRMRETGLRDVVLSRVQSFALSAVMVIFLLYFLLASGDRFMRNLMTALPSFGDKRRTLEISHHLQHEISAYLFTFTLINLVLAAVGSLAFYLIGLPNPVLWGALAGLLNFVPYLGPAVVIGIVTVVSTLTFETLPEMLVAPSVFLVITALEGQLITPMILGRRLALNPILIFLGLIFWGWLWGVAGALLAVPIMVSIKIVCDHIEALQPIGIMMER
jgi:predicted PurR-regulated permease PerM